MAGSTTHRLRAALGSIWNGIISTVSRPEAQLEQPLIKDVHKVSLSGVRQLTSRAWCNRTLIRCTLKG